MTNRTMTTKLVRVARLNVLILIIVLTATFAVILQYITQPTVYGEASTLIVCADGPPVCDFEDIQDGIDAASSGDRVLVEPGAYNEALSLKSGVTVESVAGASSTLITQLNSPLVTASNISSATLRGFTIRGVIPFSSAIGIKVVSSDLTIEDSVIEDFNGDTAIGIDITGTVSVTVSNTVIKQIFGSDNNTWLSVGSAGHAYGVRARANGRLSFEQSSVSLVAGGDAFESGYWFGCSQEGGRAIGILGSGTLDVSIVNSIIDNIVGGQPCPADQLHCTWNAGQAIGIDFTGQTLNVSDSLLATIHSFSAHDSEPSFGIRTNGTNTILLSGNQIFVLNPVQTTFTSSTSSDRTPGCSQPWRDRSAVEIKHSTSFVAVNNTINNAVSGWDVRGIEISQVEQVKLEGNRVNRIAGGVHSTIGIVLNDVDQADMTSNYVEYVHASSYYVEPAYGDDGYYGGGPSTGISFRGRLFRFVNNVIHSVTSSRSSAKAVEVDADSAEIQFNTIRETKAPYSVATGLQAAAETELVIGNNSIVEHDFGLTVVATGTVWSDYNNLWANAVDYSGATSGSHDVLADPLFDGDSIWLTSASPLIDAGLGYGAPAWDIDSNARPADGNADGIWAVDIGADEYWPPRSMDTYIDVQPQTATPGSTLAHTITVANYDNNYTLWDLTMRYTFPEEYTLVEGTLGSSIGGVGISGNTIVWSDDLASNQHAHIFFEVLVDGDLADPYAIVSQASVYERYELVDTAESVVFIDPIQLYMPIMQQEQ